MTIPTPASAPTPFPRPFRTLLRAASIGSVGLVAGLYWGFSTAVMPGLARLEDPAFVAALQHINAVILTPTFGLIFTTGLVAPALLALADLRAGHRGSAGATALGWAGYTVTVVITMAVNVPLNDAIATATPTGSAASAARAAFEDPWNAANQVRAVVAGLALLALAVGSPAGRRRDGRARRHPQSATAGTVG